MPLSPGHAISAQGYAVFLLRPLTTMNNAFLPVKRTREDLNNCLFLPFLRYCRNSECGVSRSPVLVEVRGDGFGGDLTISMKKL